MLPEFRQTLAPSRVVAGPVTVALRASRTAQDMTRGKSLQWTHDVQLVTEGHCCSKRRTACLCLMHAKQQGPLIGRAYQVSTGCEGLTAAGASCVGNRQTAGQAAAATASH